MKRTWAQICIFESRQSLLLRPCGMNWGGVESRMHAVVPGTPAVKAADVEDSDYWTAVSGPTPDGWIRVLRDTASALDAICTPRGEGVLLRLSDERVEFALLESADAIDDFSQIDDIPWSVPERVARICVGGDYTLSETAVPSYAHDDSSQSIGIPSGLDSLWVCTAESDSAEFRIYVLDNRQSP